MEFIYFTIAGIALYLLSDWILNRIELARGERLQYRSVYFFFIILVLALVSFNLLSRWQEAGGAG